MRRPMVVCICAIASLAVLAGAGICQEEQKAEAPAAAPQAAPKAESIYGEVLAVNETADSMNVQYYDYDTDEEKKVDVTVTADTKFKNSTGLKGIKAGDWVDVSLSAVEGGKRVARVVEVEKAEEMEEVPAAPQGAPKTEEPAQ